MIRSVALILVRWYLVALVFSSVQTDSNFFDISEFILSYSVSDSGMCVCVITVLNGVSESNPILLVAWKDVQLC